MQAIHPDVESILLDADKIQEIIDNMGKQITKDYCGKNPLIISVLRGAVVFTADLIRAIDCELGIDFMAVSSYGDGSKSSGVVRIVKDLDTQIEGRHVIIVEDILDSGLTLNYLLKNLSNRKPASIEIAAFTVKDIPGQTPAVEPKYVGAHVPNSFIVGYGLDFAEKYRNLPYVGILKPEVYS